MPEPEDKVQPTGGQDLPEDPGYSYEDIQKGSVRDIAENTTIPEDKPKEKPEEEPEKPVVEEEPDVPLEDVAKKIAENTVQEILAQQKAEREAEETKRVEAEKAAITPEQEAEQVVKDFEEKNGRVPTWAEALAILGEQSTNKALAAMEAKQAERDEVIKSQQEADQKVVQQQQADEKHLNTVIDDELNDLYNANKLTKIVDKDNPSDPGVVERKALFDAWAKVNMERRGKGLPDIVSATRIYEFYYQKPQGQPGAQAPISGNKTSATPPGTEQEYSYQDIKKPWHFFRRKP